MEKYSVATIILRLFLLSRFSVELVAAFDIKATVKRTNFVGEASFHSDKLLASFRGIRYGQAPVGNKRFKKSVIHEYEAGTFATKTNGYVCHQKREDNSLITPSDLMDEDCLFLDIMVPLGPKPITHYADKHMADLGLKKAVYIFIHGGAFSAGSKNLNDAPELATRGDFIMVTINYRLGVFGFLTTDDGVIPANLGLWDQQLAITWVKENIGAFGGDSSRITVGGQFAGGASAVLQSFHEGNIGVFQSTIAQSGSPLAIGVLSEEGLTSALKVAERAECILPSNYGKGLSEEIFECLKGKPATHLADLNNNNPFYPIGPVFDNEFINKAIFNLRQQAVTALKIPDLISQAFADKNLLIGFDWHDGWAAIQYLSDVDAKSYNTMHEIPSSIVRSYFLGPIAVDWENNAWTREIINSIMDYYSVSSEPQHNKSSLAIDLVEMMTGIYFATPGVHLAFLHSSLPKTCQGRIEESSSSKLCDKERRGKTFVYEFRNAKSSKNEESQRLAFPGRTEFTLAAWSNFIKTGNPNVAGSGKWPEYKNETRAVCDVSQNLTDDDAGNKSCVQYGQMWSQYIPMRMRRTKAHAHGRAARGKREVLACPKSNAAETRLFTGTCHLSSFLAFVFYNLFLINH